MNLAIATVVWTLLATMPGGGVGAQTNDFPADARARIQSRITNGYCPGYVVGLIGTNGVRFFSFGQTAWESGEPPNEDSLFEIGSITKTFTCTVLSDLAVRGQLALTNPIQDFLPASVRVPTRTNKVITLQHLATHTSGLPRMPDNFNPRDWTNPYVDYAVPDLYAFLSGYTLPRNPGAQWEYSNLGMGLLGHALALRDGQDYESMIRQRITQVLGMPDTRITLSIEQRGRLAPGFSGVLPVANWDFDVLAPCGALRSTARDLATYVAANLGLQASGLYGAMTNAHRQRFSSSDARMGLAWFLASGSGGEVVWHGGNTAGYSSFVGFQGARKLGVVVLANSYIEKTDVIGLHLVDSSFALDRDPVPPNIPLTTLRSYWGRYARAADDYFDIGLRQDHLTGAYSGDRGLGFTLYATSARAFSYPAAQATCTFQTNSQGTVTGLVWNQSGASTTYPKVSPPSRLTLERQPGAVRLTISGGAQTDYVLETSPDLAHWTPFSTNSMWTSPVTVSTAPASVRQFFRLRQP